jgi:hypothetical protein
MVPCDMLHHITKYEGFLMNGVIVGCFILHEYFLIRAAFGMEVRYRGEKIFPKDEIFRKMFASPAGQKIVKIGQNWH